jgi:hypothetical protein
MILARLEAMLRRYPEVRYAPRPGIIEVPAQTPRGFAVSILDGRDHLVVAFEGWHEVFHDADEALRCFWLGLSSDARLRVLRRGSLDYRWILEVREGASWVDSGETGLMLFPFWARCEERILQNAHVDRRDVFR